MKPPWAPRFFIEAVALSALRQVRHAQPPQPPDGQGLWLALRASAARAARFLLQSRASRRMYPFSVQKEYNEKYFCKKDWCFCDGCFVVSAWKSTS
jgi:hypothetical protein